MHVAQQVLSTRPPPPHCWMSSLQEEEWSLQAVFLQRPHVLAHMALAMLRSEADVHMPKFLAFLHVAPLTSLRSWRGSSRHATVPEVFLPQMKPGLNCVAFFQECELAGVLHRA